MKWEERRVCEYASMRFVKTIALAFAIAVLSLATSQAQNEEQGKEDQGKKEASSQPDPCGQPRR